MTYNDLVERTLRQLNAGQPEPHSWPDSAIDIAACVAQARDDVAHEVMYDPARRAWLTQEFSLTLDGTGKGNLSSATSSISGEIILDGIRMGVVMDADHNVLQHILHYADFLRPQNTAYAYYNIKDRAVLTRAINTPVNSPLDIFSVNGPLTITASYVPTAVDDFPTELDPDLVNSLCRIVATKVNANRS